jgi:hypothetical protein
MDYEWTRIELKLWKDFKIYIFLANDLTGDLFGRIFRASA